jgi:hypothetical protein
LTSVVDINSPQSIIVETKGKNLEKYLSSEKKMKTKVLEAIELALEIKVILDTEANRKLLEDLGVIEITSAKTEPIEFFWEN